MGLLRMESGFMQTEYALLIHDNALAILNSHDLNDVLEQTVLRACRLFAAKHGFLYTVETSEELELKIGIGAFDTFIGHKLKAGQGIPGRVWQTGQPLLGEGYVDETMRTMLNGVLTVIAVPLKANQHIIGVLGLAFATKVEDEQNLFWLSRFAELVSIAIDNARLYSATFEMTEDITRWVQEKKAFEKMLQDKNTEIQGALEKVKQTQSQLIQQEKMAGIGYLAAGVAHEINNPLGFSQSNFATLQKYFRSMSELMLVYQRLCSKVQAEIPTLQEEAMQIAALAKQKKIAYILKDIGPLFDETNDGLNRVGNIVKALRMFSRVDQENDFAEYDLNEGVRNSLIFARNELKYIAEVRENLSELPAVRARGGQINQVLLNIILNAAHAVKDKGTEGKGVITISTYADSHFVYCAVMDNGTGIPEEARKNIFDPFFTTKPVGQGTGLGLSISYDIIVNKHQGEISFITELGKGTTFIIKLPFDTSKGAS
ncbi:MAG: GAF domain-containing protein [Pelosinus sp.]|nr:GAF domain-containing protein [Pelosinus sp.]